MPLLNKLIKSKKKTLFKCIYFRFKKCFFKPIKDNLLKKVRQTEIKNKINVNVPA